MRDQNSGQLRGAVKSREVGKEMGRWEIRATLTEIVLESQRFPHFRRMDKLVRTRASSLNRSSLDFGAHVPLAMLAMQLDAIISASS